MYVKVAEQVTANIIATEVNSLTKLLKNRDEIAIATYAEAGHHFAEVVPEYDYSQHPVIELVELLPSQQVAKHIDEVILDADEFGKKLMKDFRNENIRTGISQVPGATAGVLEAMQKKWAVQGTTTGVSLYDVLSSGSLTVADDVIDAMISDINANPGDYANISTWINVQRLENYKQIIANYLG